MSIATTFRSTLTGHSALTALVGTAIAQNAVPDEMTFPLVVYALRIDTDLGLDGTNLGDRADIAVQCWADESDDAESVAAAVRGALATVPNNAIVISEQDGYDPDQKKHVQTLNIVWMA